MGTVTIRAWRVKGRESFLCLERVASFGRRLCEVWLSQSYSVGERAGGVNT